MYSLGMFELTMIQFTLLCNVMCGFSRESIFSVGNGMGCFGGCLFMYSLGMFELTMFQLRWLCNAMCGLRRESIFSVENGLGCFGDC